MTQGKFAFGGHQGSAPQKEEWLTPPSIIEALGGAMSFDLDPCAPVNRPWPTAKNHYTIEDNGLTKPFFGRVWMNPPYSTAAMKQWMPKFAQHNHGTALIFARTDTDAFHKFVWERATALLFIRSRLFFYHVDGTEAEHNAGAPSVLCAYGDADAEILRNSGIQGKYVPLVSREAAA